MSPTFITLPLEVRNMIYGYVFDYDFVTPHVGKKGMPRFLHPTGCSDGFYFLCDPQNTLALLSLNRQISDEAAPCFYGMVKFRGKCRQIAAFIEGVGTRRRDMIRSVEISHPVSLEPGFHFDNGKTFELLGALPSLRTVRIVSSVRDFTRLQLELIRIGILNLAGKCDVVVEDTFYDRIPSSVDCYRNEYVWRCAKGTTQWTGGDLNRTSIPKSLMKKL